MCMHKCDVYGLVMFDIIKWAGMDSHVGVGVCIGGYTCAVFQCRIDVKGTKWENHLWYDDS